LVENRQSYPHLSHLTPPSIGVIDSTLFEFLETVKNPGSKILGAADGDDFVQCSSVTDTCHG